MDLSKSKGGDLKSLSPVVGAAESTLNEERLVMLQIARWFLFSFAFSAIAANAGTLAVNTAEGQIKMDGDSVKVSYAYGWQIPEPFGSRQLHTYVLFSDLPLDTNKLDHYQSMAFAVGNMARAKGAKFMEVELEADEKELHYVFPSAAAEAVILGQFSTIKVPAPKVSKGRDGLLTIRIENEQPLEYSKGIDKGKGKLTYSLSAAFQLADRTAKGAPLPAGGGAPGQAYLALHAARLKSDFTTMTKLMDDLNAAELREMRKDPNFKVVFANMLKQIPRALQVTGGLMDGNNALLESYGKRPDGKEMQAGVYMVKENGTWKLAEELAKD